MPRSTYIRYEERALAILTALERAGGEVDEPNGGAMEVLHNLLPPALRYDPGNVNGLLKTLVRMEGDGLLHRDVSRGVGTFSIWTDRPAAEAEIDITDEQIEAAELEESAPAQTPPAPGGVDVAALAMAVLDQALAAKSAATAAEARATEIEADLQASRAASAALTDELAGARAELAATDADQPKLDAERRRADQAEEACRVFREQAEELGKLNEQLGERNRKLKLALNRSEAKLAERNGHHEYPLKELIRPESLTELDRLMREPPRGS